MDKYKLVQIKKRLIALGLAGVMFGASGCTKSKDENKEPSRVSISQEYSNIDDYYIYVIRNGEAVKLYNAQNVYLLYNKETYEVNEYIFKSPVTMFGGAELYDLETEEMLAYGDGIATAYNEEFYQYLVASNYQVCIADAGNYVEGLAVMDYYSLDEIKELEPQIEKGLKIINKSKAKVLK